MVKKLKLPVSIMFSATGPHVQLPAKQDPFQNAIGNRLKVSSPFLKISTLDFQIMAKLKKSTVPYHQPHVQPGSSGALGELAQITRKRELDSVRN